MGYPPPRCGETHTCENSSDVLILRLNLVQMSFSIDSKVYVLGSSRIFKFLILAAVLASMLVLTLCVHGRVINLYGPIKQ